MKTGKAVGGVLTGLVCVLLGVVTAWGQTGTGQISGTVQDSSGGVIVGATVRVMSERTEGSRTATTSNSGTFVVPSLPAGPYTVEIESKGFRTYVIKNLEVTVGADHPMRVTLEPGPVTSTVTVSETALQVQTTEASVSSLVDGKTLSQLPLNRRNPLHFLGLVPGVVGHSATATSSSGTVTHFVNGDRGRGILTTLDGIDISDPIIPRGELTNAPVNPDMLQEFRVTTALPRAEYGRNSGAQIEMVTKGGGNRFHGSLYEFFRNTALDANDFFNNHLKDPITGKSPIPRRPLRQNQFGGGVSGPILRNKLFFFFGYEGTRRKESFLETNTALTKEARNGQFRFVKGTITTSAGMFNRLSPSLVNPTTGAVRSDVTICATPTQTNCLATYDIVKNDPRGLGLDPSMQKLINLYPSPNDFSSGDGLNTAFFRWLAPTQAPADTYAGKVDYLINSKYELSGRYTLAWKNDLIGDFINGALPKTPNTLPGRSRLSRNQSAAVGVKMIWSRSLLNDLRVGFTRNTLFFADTSHPIRSGDPVFSKVPELQTGTFTTPWIYWGGTERHPEHFQLKDNFSWQRGTHTWRFGTDMRLYRFNNRRNVGSNPQGSGISVFPGVFFTSGVVPFTGNPSSTVPADATDGARLEGMFNELLGIVAQMDQIMYSDGKQYSPGNGLVMYQRQREYSFYVQDDWRISPRLTLNLGLRYELFGVPYDAGGLQVVPDKPLDQGQVTFLKAGPGTGRQWYKRDLKDLAPAVGFAWDPWGNGKTAIRGGYRISYNRLVGWALNVVEQRQPAVGLDPQIRNECRNPSTGAIGTCDPLLFTVPLRLAELNLHPRVTVVNGLATLNPPSPNVINAKPANDRKEAPFFFDNNFRTAMVHQYSLTIQREVLPNLVAEIAYVGSRGVNLFRFVNVNQLELRANGFLNDFIKAKENLRICRDTPACKTTLRFSNQGFPGQVAVPIFAALLGSPTAPGFKDVTNIRNLDLNAVGTLADRMDKKQGFSRGPLAAFSNDSFFRANPQFDVAGIGSSTSNSWYNSLQAQVRASYRWGLQLAANYTFSKSLDDTSNETVGAGTGFDFPFDSKNVNLNKARSDFDVTHTFRAYAIYDLPVGRGRRFGRGWHPALNQVFGDWQANTIVDISSGFPFTVSSGSSTFNYFSTSPADCSPDAFQSGALNKGDPRGGVWFFSSSAATRFSRPEPGTLGTCGRNTFSSPGFVQFDFGILKSFRFTESLKLDFRTELFNAFNHANFGTPNTNIQSATFGKVTGTQAPNRILQFALKLSF